MNILFGLYTLNILISRSSNPLPLTRAATERHEAYIVSCHLIGRTPSLKEYAVLDVKKWLSQLPYPVDIMSAYYRIMVTTTGRDRYVKDHPGLTVGDIVDEMKSLGKRKNRLGSRDKAWTHLREVCVKHGLDARAVFDDLEKKRLEAS
jgi:hypothetical protein